MIHDSLVLHALFLRQCNFSYVDPYLTCLWEEKVKMIEIANRQNSLSDLTVAREAIRKVETTERFSPAYTQFYPNFNL